MFLAYQVSGATVISVSGDFDRVDETAFRKILAMAEHAPKLIVDLTRCRYIDSSGIAVLAAEYRTGRPLVIVASPQSAAGKLLRLTRLILELPVVSYLDDAFAVAS